MLWKSASSCRIRIPLDLCEYLRPILQIALPATIFEKQLETAGPNANGTAHTLSGMRNEVRCYQEALHQIFEKMCKP